MKSIEDRSRELFVSVVNLCKSLKITPVNERVIKQVVASSGSIGANFQEASCAMSNRDFVKCLKISRKEARETVHWLSGLAASNEASSDAIKSLIYETEQLGYILTSIISKQENKTEF